MDIRLDFISAEVLRNRSTPEKISFILERIKENVIVVLEEGLTPQEETGLIEATMKDTKDFHGIEFYRMDHTVTGLRERIASLIAGKKSGLTIVGPTRIVEAIKREPDYISMFAKVEASKKKTRAKKTKKKPKKKASKEGKKE
ncbi:MAG: DUF2073 domain-containing protein [Euryarchaeota archaeon]|nr:DUF2073 domain-containing protein [Euryarchaeota archaeon]